MSVTAGLRKLLRFAVIYGPRRALFKVAGRLRIGRAVFAGAWRSPAARDIGVIGCGQFAYATLGYAIATRFGRRFAAAFDRDADTAATFARFYDASVCASASDLLSHPEVRVVYVTSSHSSHAPYTIQALKAGKDVYVEKPIAVDAAQLEALLAARDAAKSHLYAGYNRPFARAMSDLKSLCANSSGPLTLVCAVACHALAEDHWYRDPREGTRICGNAGHWLDLMVHILSWRELPSDWEISCAWSDDAARDDNLSITLTSRRGDLVNIVMTSRTEPFEGIHETILLQWGDVTARIDDFRRMTAHVGPRVFRRRYWPKDVGHVAALMQPFGGPPRDFREVEASTRLMLAIADMIRQGHRHRSFRIAGALATAG